tara:strand:+ start:294 stop:458 length:165 start_codon:yes stop_codon:yes gene_type:complete
MLTELGVTTSQTNGCVGEEEDSGKSGLGELDPPLQEKIKNMMKVNGEKLFFILI